MTIEAAIGLIFALFVFCALPGPGVFAITARSLASGFQPALSLAVGMAFGDLFYVVVAMFGLAAIGQILGEFFIIVKMIGAAYLIWIGIRMWIKQPISFGEVNVRPASNFRKNFLIGFAISIGNPKVILFYLGFLPAFMDLTRLNAMDVLVVTTLVAVVITGTLAMYAYTASHIGRLFKSRRAVSRLNKGAGAVLIGTGLVIASE